MSFTRRKIGTNGNLNPSELNEISWVTPSSLPLITPSRLNPRRLKFWKLSLLKKDEKIPDKKQMGYFGVSRCVSQVNNLEMTSSMSTRDVHGLEDLSLNNFTQEILRQYIFRSVLFLQ